MKRATKKEVATQPNAAGELVGITLFNDKPHQLFLLEAESGELTWKQAQEWAKKQGGELPTRIDMIVLWKNARAKFKPRWHWTGEQHESLADSAWVQTFGSGYQTYAGKGTKDLARAVRRVAI